MNIYTVTAIDEFDRVFKYSQVEYETLVNLLNFDFHHYLFKHCVREILKEMGNAAWAEWISTIEEWDD